MSFLQEFRTPIAQTLPGTVTGLGASGLAVVKIPPGATYASISLVATIAGAAATRANLQAMWTQIRCTISGTEIFTLSGKELIGIIEYYSTGLIADTGILTIPFQRLWQKEIAAALNPDWGTLGESSVQFEITQTASTIDSALCFAEVEPVAQELGAYVSYERLTPTFAATGYFIYPDLFKQPGTFLYALHFVVPTPANLTNIELIADNVSLVNTPPAVLNAYGREGTPNRTPQTAQGFVHMDFCRRGIDADALPLSMSVLTLRLLFANAAPNTFSIIQEIGRVKPGVGRTA
jgi:hypothetical protein